MQIKDLQHGDEVYAVSDGKKYPARIEMRFVEESPSKKEQLYLCISGRFPTPLKDWRGTIEKRVVLKGNKLLQNIIPTVCVADGEGFTGLEFEFIDFLVSHDLNYIEAEHLYKKPFDLSGYTTIAFQTTGVYEEKLKKLFQFDTYALKTVVVLNEDAYKKSKALADFLGIKLIGFNHVYWDVYKETGDFAEKVLFDPKLEWNDKKM